MESIKWSLNLSGFILPDSKRHFVGVILLKASWSEFCCYFHPMDKIIYDPACHLLAGQTKAGDLKIGKILLQQAVTEQGHTRILSCQLGQSTD